MKKGSKNYNRKRPPPFTEEHKMNLSKGCKGRSGIYKRKIEHNKKVSDALKKKGIFPQMYKNWRHPKSMLGKHHSEKTKEKIRKTKTVLKHSIETRIKMSKIRRELFGGEKSHLWKGGITSINAKVRTSFEYKLWRKSVFER